ncbi:MAG: DUF1905 domain-containing protein [Bacteroidetes bacterium]|nr:DUF1905 domain-containing protein [Bacteroidota bacterium]
MSPELGYFGITVPDFVFNDFHAQKISRVVCLINDKIRYQCAFMPKGEGEYYVLINKTNQKKIGVKEGDEVLVNLEPDTSEYGLPMPEELQELLKQDKEGNDFFHQLTPGKQRNLIHIAGQAKSSEVRLKKALVILEHLKEQNGKLDFKLLNVAFKAANRKF